MRGGRGGARGMTRGRGGFGDRGRGGQRGSSRGAGFSAGRGGGRGGNPNFTRPFRGRGS